MRDELTRVASVCHGCRQCIELCGVFPRLFELIDRHDDHDAGRLTPFEQDQVVEECFQCKRCVLDCPYAPGLHDGNVDLPRLMLRAQAMRHRNGLVASRDRASTALLARSDLVGTVASATAPLINALLGKPESTVRKAVAKVTGISAKRLLPPFAKERFSTWFKNRQRVRVGERQGRVTVYPTCTVEYHETAIGKDLVKVYERNGIECELSGARCCGAPWLHAGDIGAFTQVATRNVAVLASEVRSGSEVVVPQPTCAYVVKHDYPVYVGGDDAELVGAHTFDPAEYLLRLHGRDGATLDLAFTGQDIGPITYHAPCHLRAQEVGLPGRDLIRLTGADVTVVSRCSGIDGAWGLRAGNDGRSIPFAVELAAEVDRADGDVVVGDCHLANTAIAEQTGSAPCHPIQIVARAYGIPTEE